MFMRVNSKCAHQVRPPLRVTRGVWALLHAARSEDWGPAVGDWDTETLAIENASLIALVAFCNDQGLILLEIRSSGCI
jgi:hypothetical protein